MLNSENQIWRCASKEIQLLRPQIVAILNVTPDSFSDGGAYKDADEAVAYGLAAMDAGAAIIDVGGESTRPGATPVTPEEEAERVVPVVRQLLQAGACVSIDTRHPQVAQLCLNLGAHIINDVTGFTNPKMVEIASHSDCGCVVMHPGNVRLHAKRKSVLLDSDPRQVKRAEEQLTLPDESTQHIEEALAKSSRGIEGVGAHFASGTRRFSMPEAAPIMRRIMGFLGDQARVLMQAGVEHERICIDPGTGFGKESDEDVIMQRATAQLASMGYPLMCAVSRKSFLGALTGVIEPQDRDAATLGAALAAAEAGARLLRVHDVTSMHEALKSYWAIAHPATRRAFVALGSNVGDVKAQLARATKMMNELPMTCVVEVSHAYETDPAMGLKDPVANAVAELQTELSSDVLLDHLLAIEKVMQRKRPKDPSKKGPRTIDLDLLYVDDETFTSKHLNLPHPGIGERDFVIIPMEDLMSNPERFLTYAGIDIRPREERIGIVRQDLGAIDWEDVASDEAMLS